MRRASTLILVAILLGVVDAAREVSAQNVMTVAALPGVPIAQEPHHHLVFQNSFVNVYEIESRRGMPPSCTNIITTTYSSSSAIPS